MRNPQVYITRALEMAVAEHGKIYDTAPIEPYLRLAVHEAFLDGMKHAVREIHGALAPVLNKDSGFWGPAKKETT